MKAPDGIQQKAEAYMLRFDMIDPEQVDFLDSATEAEIMSEIKAAYIAGASSLQGEVERLRKALTAIVFEAEDNEDQSADDMYEYLDSIHKIATAALNP